MVATREESFSVAWKHRDDAHLTWLYDPLHFPKPLTPLAGEFLNRMYLEFMSARTVFVNGYAFAAGLNPRPPSPDIEKRGVVDVWTNDYLPRLREFSRRTRSADYESMGLAELGEAAGEIMAEGVRTFGYTMVVISGFSIPTFRLVQFLEGELGPEGPRLAATLLQGFENGTAAAGAGLSNLAEAAASYPAVAQALREGRYDSIASVEGGPEFMALFKDYLDEYGWRVESWGELHLPTWSEDPRTPLMLIGRYLADPERSPAASIRRASEQREEAVREVEGRFSGEKLDRFRTLLSMAQAHVPMSEGRALWQLITIGSLRVPFLALGRKLVEAGAFDSPDDAFYMTTAELAQVARDPSPSTRAVVAERKADHERWGRLAPPPFVGTPPDPSRMPPERAPMARLFFGVGPPQVEGREIKGQAASKGTVRGRARIIHHLSEADLLQAGEVLVCTTTAPPWTPLFAIAGAVVTDSGGVLSHSAICAREYAIPCVVGTQVATRVIPDGAIVTVDGTKGTVTIEG